MRVNLNEPCRPPLRCPSCGSADLADEQIVHTDQCRLFDATPPPSGELRRPALRKRQVRP